MTDQTQKVNAELFEKRSKFEAKVTPGYMRGYHQLWWTSNGYQGMAYDFLPGELREIQASIGQYLEGLDK